MALRTVLALLVLIFVSGCATNTVTGRSQLMLVSEQSAISQSALAYDSMISQLDDKGKLNDDPELQQRVDRITGNLVAQAIRYRPETQSWAWRVKIIDDPDVINAFCMAGGKMAVYTGLIEKIEPTDDELAQVMGHEIGHALANHSAEKMSVRMAAQLGVAVFAALGSNSRDRAVRQDTGVLAASLIVTLPNSRAAETEADHIGLELAARAGYDPNAAASLWQKMMDKSGNHSRADFTSTHPASVKRIEDLQARVPLVRAFYEAPGPRPTYDLASGILTGDSAGALSQLSADAAKGGPLMLNTPEYDRFTKGEVVLTCAGPCALGYSLRGGGWKKLHDAGQWRQLATQIVDAGYQMDLTYYYLGRAALALGFTDSATTYFSRSVEASAAESTRCKGRFVDWCEGFALPEAAQSELAALTERRAAAGGN